MGKYKWFRKQLLAAWDDGSSDWIDLDGTYYVQWSKFEFGLQVECVSNRFLPPERMLSAGQRSRLRAAGFEPPLGEDLPNYWRVFFDPDDLGEAASLLIEAVDILQLGPGYGVDATEEDPWSGVTVIVPVQGGARHLVELALAGIISSGPTDRLAVVDLFGVPQDELPMATTVVVSSGQGSLPDGPLIVQAVPTTTPVDGATALRLAADVITTTRDLVGDGRRVVVVGPPLAAGYELVYGAAVADVGGALVLCVAGEPTGPAERLTRPLRRAGGDIRTVLVTNAEHEYSRSRLVIDCDALVAIGDVDSEIHEIEQQIQVLGAVATGTEPAEHLLSEVRDARVRPLVALCSRAAEAYFEHGDPAGIASLLTRVVKLIEAERVDPSSEMGSHLTGLVSHVLGPGLLNEVGRRDDRSGLVILRAVQAMAEAGWSNAREALAEAEFQARFALGSKVQRPATPAQHVLEATSSPSYVPAGRTCHGKGSFVAVLNAWLSGPHGETIGEPSSYGGKALIHVEVGGQGFHLNGDTKAAGVRQYLDLVSTHGPALPWHVVANASGKLNKVAFGEPPTPIRYFYLYADQEASAPYTV